MDTIREYIHFVLFMQPGLHILYVLFAFFRIHTVILYRGPGGDFPYIINSILLPVSYATFVFVHTWELHPPVTESEKKCIFVSPCGGL